MPDIQKPLSPRAFASNSGIVIAAEAVGLAHPILALIFNCKFLGLSK
jgi:hypothetical protein